MRPELIQYILTGDVMKFYKSKEWLLKRTEILERDHQECQHCKVKIGGGFHIAEEVHHILHLRQHPLLALTNSNLISLCQSCHNIQHPEKLHKQEPKGFINQERW